MTPTPQHGFESNDDSRALLTEIRDNTRTMAVKLFGTSDANQENDNGRLPQLESSAKRAHVRVDNVERKILWYSGAACGAAAVLELILQRILH